MILNVYIQIIIVFSVILFFLLAVIINGLTKSPDNIELPEQCSTCSSDSCFIKFDRKPKTKESIEEYYKNCEENENHDTKEN